MNRLPGLSTSSSRFRLFTAVDGFAMVLLSLSLTMVRSKKRGKRESLEVEGW